MRDLLNYLHVYIGNCEEGHVECCLYFSLDVVKNLLARQTLHLREVVPCANAGEFPPFLRFSPSKRAFERGSDSFAARNSSSTN